MKKSFAMAVLAASLAVPFTAQAQAAYIGASAGNATHKLDVPGYLSANDDERGYKLYGGYHFNENFGVELGYSHLGKLSGADGSDLLNDNAEYEGQSVYLAAIGTMPLTESFSVFGKAGLARNRVTITFIDNDAREETNKSSLLLGLGAAYHFNPQVSVVFEYEHYGKMYDDDIVTVKADMLSLGVRYQF